ncbi:PepSY-like domain-containing protein [Nonlabens sp.]|uniref:PepSY-like domain-containing protein n=1 Tax=Nonlabens sp. TaxID=1888209 RepID=UPI003262D5DA
MKKQILIIGAAIAMISAANAQEIPQNQVPSVIVNDFHKQFPKATDIEWEMDGSTYHVEFELRWNIDHEIWYTTDGKISKHKEDISQKELPKAVLNSIEVNFKGYSIDDLERITDNGSIFYKMEMKNLIKKDWDIVINSNGKIINQIVD